MQYKLHRCNKQTAIRCVRLVCCHVSDVTFSVHEGEQLGRSDAEQCEQTTMFTKLASVRSTSPTAPLFVVSDCGQVNC